MTHLLRCLLLMCVMHTAYSLMCYQCSPATPGCDPFNWRGVGYLGSICPEEDDICVKLIERKGAEEIVTRDCLSSFQGLRTDIPADKYEGCRKSSPDIMLAHYVNNSIKEYDVKRDLYETTWCFCFLDHRCNGSDVNAISASLLLFTLLCTVLKQLI